jgi:hypothetical protein
VYCRENLERNLCCCAQQLHQAVHHTPKVPRRLVVTRAQCVMQVCTSNCVLARQLGVTCAQCVIQVCTCKCVLEQREPRQKPLLLCLLAEVQWDELAQLSGCWFCAHCCQWTELWVTSTESQSQRAHLDRGKVSVLACSSTLAAACNSYMVTAELVLSDSPLAVTAASGPGHQQAQWQTTCSVTTPSLTLLLLTQEHTFTAGAGVHQTPDLQSTAVSPNAHQL